MTIYFNYIYIPIHTSLFYVTFQPINSNIPPMRSFSTLPPQKKHSQNHFLSQPSTIHKPVSKLIGQHHETVYSKQLLHTQEDHPLSTLPPISGNRQRFWQTRGPPHSFATVHRHRISHLPPFLASLGLHCWNKTKVSTPALPLLRYI